VIALLLQNAGENLTAAEGRLELWGELSLADPLFLIALPLAWLALWYGRSRRGRLRGRIPAVPARLGATSLAQRLGFVPVLLQGLALSLVVLALARPLRGDVRTTSVSEGVDIAVVIDRSSSMTLQDLDYEGRVDRGRTRLEVVQQVVADFATRRMTDREGNADRVAVFSFARYPQILCPFTLDADAVRGFVDSIEPATGNTPEDGTAIGMALAKAVAVLRETDAESKIIVLLSDGEETVHAIEPLETAPMAAEEGIRIYTVYAARYVQTGRGFRDADRVQAEALQQIAAQSGGRFFRAKDQQGLEDAYATIEELERTPREEERSIDQYDLYPRLLMLGLLSYALAWLLSSTVLRRMG
jgi:Ca-activated chloride channel homolog